MHAQHTSRRRARRRLLLWRGKLRVSSPGDGRSSLPRRTVWVSSSTHEQLVQAASQRGVSINKLVDQVMGECDA